MEGRTTGRSPCPESVPGKQKSLIRQESSAQPLPTTPQPLSLLLIASTSTQTKKLCSEKTRRKVTEPQACSQTLTASPKPQQSTGKMASSELPTRSAPGRPLGSTGLRSTVHTDLQQPPEGRSAVEHLRWVPGSLAAQGKAHTHRQQHSRRSEACADADHNISL